MMLFSYFTTLTMCFLVTEHLLSWQFQFSTTYRSQVTLQILIAGQDTFVIKGSLSNKKNTALLATRQNQSTQTSHFLGKNDLKTFLTVVIRLWNGGGVITITNCVSYQHAIHKCHPCKHSSRSAHCVQLTYLSYIITTLLRAPSINGNQMLTIIRCLNEMINCNSCHLVNIFHPDRNDRKNINAIKI